MTKAIFIKVLMKDYIVRLVKLWIERQLVDGKCPDCGRPVEHCTRRKLF